MMPILGRLVGKEAIERGLDLPSPPSLAKNKAKIIASFFVLGIITGGLGFIAALISSGIHAASWAKKKIRPSAHVLYKREIKNAILDGLKAAAVNGPFQIQTNESSKTTFIQRVNQLVQKIKNSKINPSMDDIDALTKEIAALSYVFLDKYKNVKELKPIFKFLQICATARMIPDGKNATQKYGLEKLYRKQDGFVNFGSASHSKIDPNEEEHSRVKKADEENRFRFCKGARQNDSQDLREQDMHDEAITVESFNKKWKKSLQNNFGLNHNSKLATFHWTIANLGKSANSLLSEKDSEHIIVCDALQGNPSFIAHELNGGIQFVHSPTPSAPNNSPLFRMYLEKLKGENEEAKAGNQLGRKRHIHFQYQSSHEPPDFARLQQLHKIAKEYSDVFQQAVFSFDALKSEKGEEIMDQFVESSGGAKNIDDFFDQFQKWVMPAADSIQSLDRNRPIMIPKELLNESQIKEAFEIAKKICNSQIDKLETEKDREAFAHVMQDCLYGVLMNAIAETQEDKQNLYISGGCKQDVDRGPVCNLILKFFSLLLSEQSINDAEFAKLMATVEGRPQLGAGRAILKRRAVHGVNFLTFVGDQAHQDAMKKILKEGIEEIQKRKPSISRGLSG